MKLDTTKTYRVCLDPIIFTHFPKLVSGSDLHTALRAWGQHLKHVEYCSIKFNADYSLDDNLVILDENLNTFRRRNIYVKAVQGDSLDLQALLDNNLITLEEVEGTIWRPASW